MATPSIEMEITEKNRYEVKTFAYDEDGPGIYRFMTVRFKGDGNEVLEGAGWRGSKYVIFMEVSGGVKYADNDQFGLCQKITGPDDDSLVTLMTAVKDGGMWPILEDGKTYTPEEIDEIFGD